MKDFYLIILMLAFQIGIGLTFSLGGVMSVGWMLALLYTFLYIFRSKLFKIPEFRYISKLFLLLVGFQIVAEFMAGNTFQNGIKGVAVNVVSYASFFFLVSLLIKKQNLIVWALVGMIIRMLIFGKESESSAEQALAGEDAAYLKFYIGPLILLCMLTMSVFFKSKRFTYIYMMAGVFFVVAGARSMGLILFLTGLFVFLVRFKKTNVTRMLKKYALVFILGLYGVYAIYVTNVENGSISSGNNVQLLDSSNPYNPLEIIKYSRTDSWVAVLEFMDKPLWGYGSWANDPGFKYHIIMSKMTNKDLNLELLDDLTVLPAHSVIFGRGAHNGIFVMVLTIMIIYFFVKRGFLLLNKDSVYMFILINFLYGLLWDSFFSPIGSFRDSFPLRFAFIFVCWIQMKNNDLSRRVQLQKQNSHNENLLRNNG